MAGGTMRSLPYILSAVLLPWSSLHALTQERSSPASLVQVGINGLRNDKACFCAQSFLPQKASPKKSEKAVAHAQSEIAERHATCRFSGLTPGNYAVSVFHDENSNRKLDTNFIGIPGEDVGASNNARGHFGPPKFDSAAFQFSGNRVDLKITITYL